VPEGLNWDLCWASARAALLTAAVGSSGNWRSRLDLHGTFGDMVAISRSRFSSAALRLPFRSERGDTQMPFVGHGCRSSLRLIQALSSRRENTVSCTGMTDSARPAEIRQLGNRTKRTAKTAMTRTKLPIKAAFSWHEGRDGASAYRMPTDARRERRGDHEGGRRNHWFSSSKPRWRGKTALISDMPPAVRILLQEASRAVSPTTLEWTEPALRFTNVNEANAFVRRDYRKGW